MVLIPTCIDNYVHFVLVMQFVRYSTFYSIKNNYIFPPQSIFGVSAYGQKRPLNENISFQERSDNRRIDFRFIMFIPSSKNQIDLFIKQLKKNI